VGYPGGFREHPAYTVATLSSFAKIARCRSDAVPIEEPPIGRQARRSLAGSPSGGPLAGKAPEAKNAPVDSAGVWLGMTPLAGCDARQSPACAAAEWPAIHLRWMAEGRARGSAPGELADGASKKRNRRDAAPLAPAVPAKGAVPGVPTEAVVEAVSTGCPLAFKPAHICACGWRKTLPPIRM
jgi:hypothetical protein